MLNNIINLNENVKITFTLFDMQIDDSGQALLLLILKPVAIAWLDCLFSARDLSTCSSKLVAFCKAKMQPSAQWYLLSQALIIHFCFCGLKIVPNPLCYPQFQLF